MRSATWSLASAGTPLAAALGSDGRGCWGEGHHDFVRARFGRTASWILITEDLPDPENRVTLSPDLRDAAGLAAPRIFYRMADNSRRLIAWHVERARASLEAAGAHATEVIHYPANGHLLGTARMGTDPASSVVRPDCRAHDVPNLLIPDGSVFVTAGSANPTTTIAAVALRAAERLIADRASLPRPAHRVAAAVPGAYPGAAARTAQSAPPPDLPGESERAKLRVLADAWIPAAGDRPSASAAGAADAQLDRVLAARPDLAPAIRAALAAPGLPDAPATALLRFAVAAAYYLSPGVRRALRYDPENVTPVRPLDLAEIAEEGLLDHLLESAP